MQAADSYSGSAYAQIMPQRAYSGKEFCVGYEFNNLSQAITRPAPLFFEEIAQFASLHRVTQCHPSGQAYDPLAFIQQPTISRSLLS